MYMHAIYINVLLFLYSLEQCSCDSLVIGNVSQVTLVIVYLAPFVLNYKDFILM